mmetsp:Transcript_7510/g.15556  ORF Transcript_7510/g.15556 Transcript_7510/m.15556 type:complete len:84 (+) Transcript_7510:145-396(+)
MLQKAYQGEKKSNRFFPSESHCCTRTRRLRGKFYDNRDDCRKLHAATKVTAFDPSGFRVAAKKVQAQQRSKLVPTAPYRHSER